MPKRLGKAKQMELKEKFWKMDTSRDQKLNFNEMKRLLLEGNPNFTDKELQALFNTIDANHNGTVDFEEFIEFLYGVQRVYVPAPEPVVLKFTEFCGKDMDCTEFSKMCADCGIIGRSFRKEDVATTFARVLPRGKRRINCKVGADGFSEYDQLLCLVAEKKDMEVGYIHELIAEGTITSSGTKPDDVRLHDDLSTYTGAAAIGSKVAPGTVAQRPPSQSNYDPGPEGDWEALRAPYRAFQAGGGLTNREFAKLCEDSNLYDDGALRPFLMGDADVVFAKLKQQKLNWEMFQEAVRMVAEKKRWQLEDVMSHIADCKGPVVRCTKPDEVRLHDDKSTYTGIHTG